MLLVAGSLGGSHLCSSFGCRREARREGRDGEWPTCVYCSLSLSLYLGWASDGLAVVVRQAGTHFKLAHAAIDDDDEPLSCNNNNNAFLK